MVDSFQKAYKKNLLSRLDNFVKEGYIEGRQLYDINDGKFMPEEQQLQE